MSYILGVRDSYMIFLGFCNFWKILELTLKDKQNTAQKDLFKLECLQHIWQSGTSA